MFIQLKIEEAREPLYINIHQISTINGRVLKMANNDIVTLTEDGLHDLLLTVLPKEKKVKELTVNTEMQQLFEQLHKLTGGKGKTVFSLNREKKLGELLGKHRMTKEDLITAATNIGKDAFLQGDNDSHKRYGDIDYLLRPDKAAKWSEEQKDKKKGMFD